MRRARSLAGWIVVLGAMSALGVASAPARENAPQRVVSHRLLAHAAKASTSARGAFLGGVTASGWPVVVQMSTNFKTVKRAVIAIRTQCSPSGKAFIDHDTYLRLRVSRSGRFGASFGPQDNGSPSPGITETAQGSITGRFNKARTKVSGTWRLTFVDSNAAGATVDTCDSGSVAWHAQQ